MVFCSIEGGKQYASLRSKADVRDVHMELIAVMRGALKQVPGGYFVRHQDGEFKYLVVFAHPEVGGWVVGWLRLTDCGGGWNAAGQESCGLHAALFSYFPGMCMWCLPMGEDGAGPASIPRKGCTSALV